MIILSAILIKTANWNVDEESMQSVEARIKDLLKQMTPEEKAGLCLSTGQK